MINTNVADKAIKNYINNVAKSSKWILADNELYNLCKKYPNHKDADEIVAKLWIIGRSYAAAIERRKNAKGFKGDFYYDVVAPKIISIGNVLDAKINNLNNKTFKTEELLSTHAYLMSIFSGLTGMNKRSLASKYLHFHSPNTIFIYDSVASKALRKMVNKPTKEIQEYMNINPNLDEEYVDFYLRAVELKKHIEEDYNLPLTIKQFDRLLLNA